MSCFRTALAALLLLIGSAPVLAQTDPARTVARIAESPRFEAAQSALDQDHDRFVEEIVTLTEIPAPPLKEAVRAQALPSGSRRSAFRRSPSILRAM